MKHRVIKKIFGIALLLTIVIAGFGQAVLQLWNWLMPVIFGLPRIGFGQTLGLMALSWILLGGMRGMRAGRRHWRRGCGEGRYQNFAADSFTPEQRENFRHRFDWHCGVGGKWAAGRAKSGL